MINVTKDNFEAEVLQSSVPVLLDFWAPWCGPCRMLAPIVEELEEETPNMTLGKVNVDEQMELAVQFGIVSIPTLIVIRDGQVAGKMVGLSSKEEILELLG